MDILSAIPQDATFDQEGTLQRYVERGYDEHYCYDLKSATDLIPSQLYVWVLGHLLGSEHAEAWMGLLVNRDFKVG
jgi:hypothetical protein